MRRASISAAVSTVVLCACGREPTATTPRAIPDLPAAAAAAKTAASASPTIAIDDAVSRLLPALDASTAALLKPPLLAVAAALKSRDGATLQSAILVARLALARAVAANAALAPDLDAIGLALDAAAAN